MRIKLLAILLLPLAAIAAIRIDSGASIQPIAIGDEIQLTVPGIQAETSAWQSAVTANGGTYNATDTRAVDYFISQCKAKGIWSLIDWTALFAGRNLNAALVPVKHSVGSSVITNNNFVEGDFSPTVGLTGNGTTKDLVPGLDRNNCRGPDNVSMGVFVAANAGVSGAARGLAGTVNNSNLWILLNSNGTQASARVNNSSTINVDVTGTPQGLCCLNRTPGGDSFVFVRSDSASAAQTTGIAGAAITIFSRGGTGYSNQSIGGAWFGAGLTSQQLTDFRAIWNQAMIILGRPTP